MWKNLSTSVLEVNALLVTVQCPSLTCLGDSAKRGPIEAFLESTGEVSRMWCLQARGSFKTEPHKSPRLKHVKLPVVKDRSQLS
jgi:hypothetical protein